MRGAMTTEEVSGFIGRLMSAREATSPLQALPEIKDAKAWDGKDEAAGAQEEEFSLDDLMNEKLDG